MGNLTNSTNLGVGYFQQLQTNQGNTYYKHYYSNTNSESIKNKSTIVSYPSNKNNQMSSSTIK